MSEKAQAKRPAADRREIRVFISSTFRDMQEEREELVKQIFPQLRRLCESRGVTWGEVDLRWGIAEEQATHIIVFSPLTFRWPPNRSRE